MSYEVAISGIQGDRYGSVDDADRRRATDAAEAVLRAAGVPAAAAEAAYQAQWQEFDDEDRMTGAALVWIEARQAADVALTSAWADPAAEVFCTLTAR